MALSEDQIRRYSRQILLRDVGGVGQERLLGATAVVSGPPVWADDVHRYLEAGGMRIERAPGTPLLPSSGLAGLNRANCWPGEEHLPAAVGAAGSPLLGEGGWGNRVGHQGLVLRIEVRSSETALGYVSCTRTPDGLRLAASSCVRCLGEASEDTKDEPVLLMASLAANESMLIALGMPTHRAWTFRDPSDPSSLECQPLSPCPHGAG